MTKEITRLQPQERKAQILKAALKIAVREGYSNIKREAIASEAGVAVGLINRYFNTMPQLKRAVMRAAIDREVLKIIAQGLVVNDPQARKASIELKQKAMRHIS